MLTSHLNALLCKGLLEEETRTKSSTRRDVITAGLTSSQRMLPLPLTFRTFSPLAFVFGCGGAIKNRDPQSLLRSDSRKEDLSGILSKKGESKMCRPSVPLSLSLSIIWPDRPDDSDDRYGGKMSPLLSFSWKLMYLFLSACGRK